MISKFVFYVVFSCFSIMGIHATKWVSVGVIDKDYIMVTFIDGQVHFNENTSLSNAYTSHNTPIINNTEWFGNALNTDKVMLPVNWTIKSDNDENYKGEGLRPITCYRKSKINGMAQNKWNNANKDFDYDYTMEHAIFLKLPYSLQQGKSYEILINPSINSDKQRQRFTYDFFQCRSEAVHVNLVGYISGESVKAADLYFWLGNGGARNYSTFNGKKVFIVDVLNNKTSEVGQVSFWKESSPEAGKYNLTASDVYNADFTSFSSPGKYRLAIEDVGCSEEFEIRNDVYFEPFRVSTLGFFYMRIGQDNLNMVPVPRRPLFIPGKSPENTKVLITTMHPYHPEWRTFSHGDVWDRPTDWHKFVKPGNPENSNAYGGHSDALDWDRHLGHVSITYDMMLPYILTDGKLSDDNLGIAESGNGIPDIIDEARNEVDFWLRLRHGKGYSHGLTNPDKDNVLYQAENTAIAAWANAVNSSMLAYCFEIEGNKPLAKTYTDSAQAAFTFASGLSDQMLDKRHDIGIGSVKGSDLKFTAAAYLYNLTGNIMYEDIIYELGKFENDSTIIIGRSTNKLWAVAAYLKTKQYVHYPEMYKRMAASVCNEAMKKEVAYSSIRPSRRATDNEHGYFKTIQNVQRTIVAHAVTTDPEQKKLFLNALILEADWGLGRNSLNTIYMTTAITLLQNKRSVENIYTTGRNDGTPGLHPGHTPYLNTDDWSPALIMGRPSWMTTKCFPEFKLWPASEAYFNTRYVWAHSEFTPQQTMRGKAALYGYLYGLNKAN